MPFLSKKEFRKFLLEGMCKCAEYIHEYFDWGTGASGIYFDGKCPKSFKPSVADKFLFNKFIDEAIDLIPDNYRYKDNAKLMAVKIMNAYYYPNYDPAFKSKTKNNFGLIMKILGS